MPRGSRSDKKGYRRIGENGPNYRPTWLKIMSYSSPKRGGHQKAGGLWNSHIHWGIKNWWEFADGNGNKMCRYIHPGGENNGVDGGKVRRNNRHDVHADTTTALVLPTITSNHSIPNTTATTSSNNKFIRTSSPTTTACLPSNNKKEVQMRKRPTLGGSLRLDTYPNPA